MPHTRGLRESKLSGHRHNCIPLVRRRWLLGPKVKFWVCIECQMSFDEDATESYWSGRATAPGWPTVGDARNREGGIVTDFVDEEAERAWNARRDLRQRNCGHPLGMRPYANYPDDVVVCAQCGATKPRADSPWADRA